MNQQPNNRANQTEKAKETEQISSRHLQFGWWCLLCFLSLGIFLEALHGFKIRWYLDVGNDTRRLMLRLAHAHGTLLSVVNIAFGLTLQPPARLRFRAVQRASPCLMSATILMPLGFLLGGIVIYGGDPGLGIFLVPLGGFLLFLSILNIAWGLSGQAAESGTGEAPRPRKRQR